MGKLLLYAILKTNRAKDLNSYQELTTGDATIHHIFPEAILAGSEFEELINDIGNLTITTLGTNINLRSEKPEVYLQRVPPDIRRTYFIPDDPAL